VASKGVDWYLLGVLVGFHGDVVVSKEGFGISQGLWWASMGTWWPQRGCGGLHGVVVASKGVGWDLPGVLVGLHGDVVVSTGTWWSPMGWTGIY